MRQRSADSTGFRIIEVSGSTAGSGSGALVSTTEPVWIIRNGVGDIELVFRTGLTVTPIEAYATAWGVAPAPFARTYVVTYPNRIRFGFLSDAGVSADVNFFARIAVRESGL